MMLSDDHYEWITIESTHARIHVPSGSYAQAHQNILLERAEQSRRTVLSRLFESDYQETLHLFYVDSREDMERLTGRRVAGFSYFSDSAVVLVYNKEWRPFERHELAHTVTLGTWTSPAGPAVVEGLATYVEGVCGGYQNGRLTRTILDMGSVIPLETLSRYFRQQDDLVAYLQAASTIEFMVERRGPDALDLLWTQGLEASPALLETSPENFQQEFESWLSSKYDAVPDHAWEAIHGLGCGIEARAAHWPTNFPSRTRSYSRSLAT
jgi:hypothetical protein